MKCDASGQNGGSIHVLRVGILHPCRDWSPRDVLQDASQSKQGEIAMLIFRIRLLSGMKLDLCSQY
jgi:hypothetical protein